MRAFLLALAVCLVVACKGREENKPAPVAAAASDSTAVNSKGSACPQDGKWHECSAIYRLERAGLAPRRDSVPAAEKELSRPGLLIHVGNSELELFLYPDEAARALDEKKLDTAQFIDPSREPTIRRERTIIRSANLLGLLKSLNSHQRERVSDALTAGPPQPP
jgi:hypothetical protein